MTAEVMAIGARTNNYDLIANCHQLGYITEPVLDMTYGLGVFWRRYRPEQLTTVDSDPRRKADHVCDFRALPFDDGAFGTVVFDPPYKLNGTSRPRGPAVADDRYGVAGDYLPTAERHGLIRDGIIEGARVLRRRGYLLVKCQDQVSSGRVHWQTRMFSDHAERHGCRLVDMLHVLGYRQQPPGRVQEHARRDYSTLLVLRKVSK